MITMMLRRPMTPQSVHSAAGDSSNVDTTRASEASHDAAANSDLSKPEDTYQEQSATRVVLLLISVFMSMFLVSLDRTIISTV